MDRQRVKRSAGGASTLYAYDEAGHLTGEYTNAGVLVQETVWLGDVPIATLRANGSGGVNLYFVHSDHLNTPRLVTDFGNNLHWRWDSDAFGTTVPNMNPAGLGVFEYSLRFPGQQYDAAVGLHYNYFRDYDPAVGRYAQSDPLLKPNRLLTDELAFFVPLLARTPAWLHAFAYVRSRPTDDTDSLGLGPWGVLKCMWYHSKLDEYNKECRSQCPGPSDIMGQIKFMQAYNSHYISDALLKCTCAKAEQDGQGNLCAKWLATCISAGVSGPPRPQ